MAESEGEVLDLVALATAATTWGAAWAYQGAELNANLLVFDGGAGVEPHVNDEVDVLIVALAGAGYVELAGARRELRAGQAVVIPRGARRALGSAGGRFAYLSCHRRRGPLWPTGLARRTEER